MAAEMPCQRMGQRYSGPSRSSTDHNTRAAELTQVHERSEVAGGDNTSPPSSMAARAWTSRDHPGPWDLVVSIGLLQEDQDPEDPRDAFQETCE